MPITRRAFGTLKTSQNAQIHPSKKIDAGQPLKRSIVSANSPGIPTKRKNIQNIDKENQIKIESIEKKITEIKITEEGLNISSISSFEQIRAVKSQPSQTFEQHSKCIQKTWRDPYRTPEDLPSNVFDYDKSQLDVPDSESVYAFDIFKYLQNKEKHMATKKYMHKQPKINEKMRSILIDWLVEVQQNFELFHETLYLSVKYIDHYLMKKAISSSKLQLLGLTSVFIASKFEERCYPCVDDFIYMCDDAYTKDEFLQMEIDILSTLTFDVNFPLSYSFLRRYSRCSSASMETLTLARYILESSLLSYSIIDELDSKISAAALLLANRMQKINPPWTPTLAFYSGYQEEELELLALKLNKFIADIYGLNMKSIQKQKHAQSNEQNILGQNIFNKYSDHVFHQVARIQHLSL